jgi:hypothetical protein
MAGVLPADAGSARWQSKAPPEEEGILIVLEGMAAAPGFSFFSVGL